MIHVKVGMLDMSVFSYLGFPE